MNDPTPRPVRVVAAIVILLLVAAGGIALWAWPPNGSANQPQPLSMVGTPVKATAFIGSRACRECHPGEYAAFLGSGHSQTLAPAGNTAIAKQIDGKAFNDQEQPGVTWHYSLEGKDLIAEREEGTARLKAILDYALGSGRHAMTFVSLSKDGKIPPSGEEHRMSYFAHSDTVALTPGHIRKMNEPGQTATGLALPPPGVLDCIECHGTRTALPVKKGLAPETMIPNVSCERCHGPGRAHVEAAMKGVVTGHQDETALKMPFGGGEESATAQVTMCGRCHRLPSMIPTDWIRHDNSTLARFPSVGLSFSACYTKSAGALSCTTCHDPHGRTSTDIASYEATCLTCHAPATKPGSAVKPCPVNPRDGCIACHMPLRKPSDAGLRFTDHWIRKPDNAEKNVGAIQPVN